MRHSEAHSNNTTLQSQLSAPYARLNVSTVNEINEISGIITSLSTQFGHQWTTSLTEIIRDELYSQSEETRTPHLHCKLLRQLQQIDSDCYEKVNHYLNLFKRTAFEPLGAYHDANRPKLNGNANDLVRTFLIILMQIKSAQMNRKSEIFKKKKKGQPITNIDRDLTQNSITVIKAQFDVSPVTQQQAEEKQHDDDDDEEDDEDDDDDDDYNQMINNMSNQPTPRRRKLRPIVVPIYHHTLQRPNCVAVDTQINGQLTTVYELVPLQLIRTVINDVKHSMFSYQELSMRFHGNHLRLSKVQTDVCHEVIRSRLNVYPILNAVHSAENTANTLNFLYIIYHETIVPFVWHTDGQECRFGTKITAQNIRTAIPNLFESSAVDIDTNIDTVQLFADIDTVFEENRVWINRYLQRDDDDEDEAKEDGELQLISPIAVQEILDESYTILVNNGSPQLVADALNQAEEIEYLVADYKRKLSALQQPENEQQALIQLYV